MSEQDVWASMTSDDDVRASTSADAGAAVDGPGHAVRATGPADDDAKDDDIDDLEDNLDDELDDDDDDDDDDDLDEFEDDELDDDDEDDDDEADEIDFTEERYGRIPGEDDADV